MIVVIVGPTGVGKTKLSVELAKKINAEIINCDAMQVYKELTIGTAKASPIEQGGVKHHLLDFVDVTENYTVFDYQQDCRRVIKELQNEGKNIIIVGGTGLYVKAALYDYRFEKETVKRNYDDLTNEEIISRIQKAGGNLNIDVKNRRRLERSLERIENGNVGSNLGKTKLYDFITIGLTTEREKLYDIINKRVDKMIEMGLLAEVKKLYDQNIRSKAVMTGIGYKELYDYFDKKIDWEEAINLIKKRSRMYAKRQYTFFRNQMDVKWLETNYGDFDKTIDEAYELVRGTENAEIF